MCKAFDWLCWSSELTGKTSHDRDPWQSFWPDIIFLFARRQKVICQGIASHERHDWSGVPQEWFVDNLLSFNAQKTKYLLITLRIKLIPTLLTIMVIGTEIERVKCYKYLYLIIDSLGRTHRISEEGSTYDPF